jgi:hypothetical protein
MLISEKTSRFIPEGIAEVSQVFLRDAHVLPKWLGYEYLENKNTFNIIIYNSGLY